MDKSDIAFVIAAFSALFSAFSVIYARRMAINDAERMKRKSLVFEIQASPCGDYDGWYSVMATIRNFEPVAARLIKVGLKKRRKLKLLPQSAAFGDGPAYDPGKVEALPEDEAKHSIDLGYRIDALGHTSSVPGSGPIQYLWFYANGPVSASDFDLDWEWSDGTKR